MAPPGGEDLIGWHVNRGWDQVADFFGASQFRAQYNRPDIVRLVLQTRDEAEAIRRANAASDRAVEVKPVAAALPPVASILSPKDGSHFSGDSVDIAYALRSPSGLSVDRLNVLVDGQPIPGAGFEKTSSPEARGRVVVKLPRKDAIVSLIAHSGDLISAPVSVKLVYAGSGTADPLKPKLYALLVGVTGYANPDYNNIHFAARDAESLAKALETQKGGLYSDVQTKIVVDVPTRDNVLDGLYWLQRAATNRDISIIFLSGHGAREAWWRKLPRVRSDRWWTGSSPRPAPYGRSISRRTSSNWRRSRPSSRPRNGRIFETSRRLNIGRNSALASARAS